MSTEAELVHVAILFVNIGTYHMARLRGAQAAFAKRGWRLTAIELTNHSLDHPWGALNRSAEFPIVTLFNAVDGAHRDKIYGRAGARAMARALEDLQPDAVFLPGWYLASAREALRWCKAHAKPAILMSESKEDDASRQWWRELYKRRLVGRFAAALVGGRPHREYLVALGMSPNVIFNGYDIVDNEYFADGARLARARDADSRRALGLPDHYILASSRFIAKKNLVTLLRAYAQFHAAHTSAPPRLVLLGDGPQRAELEALRDQLGLRDAVLMPGFAGYEALPAYYGLAEAFVHASSTEQWGLVVNEAMASGLPVIVSRTCGCAPDLVHENVNGLAFSPDSPTELARCLRSICSDANARARMARAGEEIIATMSPITFGEGAANAVDAAAGAQR